MTLEEVKNQVIKERLGKGEYIYHEAMDECDEVWTEIAKMYATECVKASLEGASENARIGSDFSFTQGESFYVQKSSITDHKNIILL